MLDVYGNIKMVIQNYEEDSSILPCNNAALDMLQELKTANKEKAASITGIWSASAMSGINL